MLVPVEEGGLGDGLDLWGGSEVWALEGWGSASTSWG